MTQSSRYLVAHEDLASHPQQTQSVRACRAYNRCKRLNTRLIVWALTTIMLLTALSSAGYPAARTYSADDLDFIKHGDAESIVRWINPTVLFEDLKTSEDAEVRTRVAALLSQYPILVDKCTAIALLRPLLADSDTRVRSAVVTSLGQLCCTSPSGCGDMASEDSVLSDLMFALGDEDPGVRSDALWALVFTGSELAVPALTMFLSSEDETLRARARVGLVLCSGAPWYGETSDSSVVAALATVLMSDSLPAQREMLDTPYLHPFFWAGFALRDDSR